MPSRHSNSNNARNRRRGRRNPVANTIARDIHSLYQYQASNHADQYVDKFRMPLLGDNRVYKVIQTVVGTPITSSTSVPVFGAFSYSMNDVNQVASYGAVFDQYRIIGIETSFYPATQTNGNTSQGLFYSVIDYDDAASFSSVAAATEYQNCIVNPGYVTFSRSLQPKLDMAAYAGGGVFTSYASMNKQWIDFASSGVLHYGLKYAWSATSSACTMNVSSKYLIEMRNTH
jgi:hypothetical protein